MFKRIFSLEKCLKEDQIQGSLPTDQEIYKDYWSVAWPAALEGIFLNLILLADLVMVGKLGIAMAAAVGIVSQPKMIMQMIGKSLGTGVTAVISRRKGEGREQDMNSCIWQSFLITLAVYVVLVGLGFHFRHGIMWLMGANAEYIDFAVTYFSYLLIALFFKALSSILTAVETGIGKTKIVLQASVVGNLVNIALNYCLIFGKFGFLRLEIKGAAIATIAGEIVIFVILLYSVLFRNREDGIDPLHCGRKGLSREVMKPVLTVGGNAFFEQTFERIGLFLFARIIAELGTVAVGTHHYCTIIWDMYYYFGMGMGTSSSSFAGRKVGERRPDLAILYNKAAQRLGIVISIAVSILMILTRSSLFGLLVTDAESMRLGSNILILVAVIIIPQTQGQILAGALRGTGDNRFIAIYSLFVSAILRSVLAFFFAFGMGLGLYGMWVALLIDEILKMVLTEYRIRKGIWLRRTI